MGIRMGSVVGRLNVLEGKKALETAANGYLVCKPLDTTWLFKLTVHKYIFPSVSKVHAGSFLCLHNPPNSDMDYRIINVCAVRDHFCVCVCVCVCVCIQKGVGHIDSESAQHFWLKNYHKYFLCDGGLHLGFVCFIA